MKASYLTAHHIVSALGFSSQINMEKLVSNISGIDYNDRFTKGTTIPLALIPRADMPFEMDNRYSYLENMMLHSITQSMLQQDIDYSSDKTLLIITSTKGNIDLLSKNNLSTSIPEQRVELAEMGKAIQRYFGFYHRPLIISNACISGVMGILTAQRLVSAGLYENVIVCGGDIVSEFVVSGFQCLKAISDKPCRPFDANRNGITLGEGVGTVIVSANKGKDAKHTFEIMGGAISNDANHISGPSRSGDGLALAIQKTFDSTGVLSHDIDYISGHGTATIFNDEMEAKAIQTMGLDAIPVNSFKGYIGHTLGAAGVIEVIMGIESMKNNILIKSLGYESNGVEQPIGIILENKQTETRHFLKLSSGFGGCNAALVIRKNQLTI